MVCIKSICQPPPDDFLFIDYCDNESFLREAYQFWMVSHHSFPLRERDAIPPQPTSMSFMLVSVVYLVFSVVIWWCVADWSWSSSFPSRFQNKNEGNYSTKLIKTLAALYCSHASFFIVNYLVILCFHNINDLSRVIVVIIYFFSIRCFIFHFHFHLLNQFPIVAI